MKPKIQNKQPKNFEDVLEQLGGFGLFQLMILVMLLGLEIPASFVSFTPVFIGGHPKVWYCDNEEMTIDTICGCNGTVKARQFDTIVAQWNLICSSAWVTDFITSIQFIGMLFGNLISCKLADWYGRRYVFLTVSVIMGIGHGMSAINFGPYFYGFARFLSGFGLSGFLSVTAVYSLEFLTPKWRPLAGALGPWGEGVMILAGIAYYVRDWQWLTFVTAIPFALVFVIFPFVPESPRYLFRNKKVEEAQEVLAYIAKVNKKNPISLDVLKGLADKEAASLESKSTSNRLGYLDFFRDESLRLATIYQIIIMCSTAMTYYGISFNVKNMEASPYIIVMLLGLSDAIGYPSSLLICNRLGRRISLMIYMSLGSLSLGTLAVLELAIGLKQYPVVVVSLCLFGKFCVAGGRACSRTLIGELYPTEVRTMGSGLGAVGASIGGIGSPLIVYLGTYNPAIQYIVFAVIALVGSMFCILLTETVGKPLTDQVEELACETRRLTVRRKTLLKSMSLP